MLSVRGRSCSKNMTHVVVDLLEWPYAQKAAVPRGPHAESIERRREDLRAGVDERRVRIVAGDLPRDQIGRQGEEGQENSTPDVLEAADRFMTNRAVTARIAMKRV